EPIVDFGQQHARLVTFALLREQPREAGRSTQLPRLRVLPSSDHNRLAHRLFGIIRYAGNQQQLPPESVHLRLAEALLLSSRPWYSLTQNTHSFSRASRLQERLSQHTAEVIVR